MTTTVPLIRYTCDHHQCDNTAYAPADPGRMPPSWIRANIDGHIAFSQVKHLCPDHADELARTLTGWQTMATLEELRDAATTVTQPDTHTMGDPCWQPHPVNANRWCTLDAGHDGPHHTPGIGEWT